MNLRQPQRGAGNAQAPVDPPEHHEAEPVRYDPVPVEDVEDWKEKMDKLILQCGYGTGKGTALLFSILESMQDSLDTAHGFNDPQPEREDYV